MAEKIQFSGFYSELDCLLDTRIGTLATFGEKALSVALVNGYHKRTHDSFFGIDEAEFAARYEARDRNTLRAALVTPVIWMMKEFAYKTRLNVHNSPFHFKPKLILNIHPYRLSDEEVENLVHVIRRTTAEMADIEIVSMEYGKVTPIYLRENVSMAAMYRYDQWLETHAASGVLERHRCPEVVVTGPRLYFKPANIITPMEKDPFAEMERVSGPFVNLALLPVENFSLVVKDEDVRNALTQTAEKVGD